MDFEAYLGMINNQGRQAEESVQVQKRPGAGGEGRRRENGRKGGRKGVRGGEGREGGQKRRDCRKTCLLTSLAKKKWGCYTCGGSRGPLATNSECGGSMVTDGPVPAAFPGEGGCVCA